MHDLVKQEQFELEVLDRLNSGKLLSGLVFVGGTMLRLCYGLNRFSIDLDFWATRKINSEKFVESCREYLVRYYSLTGSADRFHTALFELKSKSYPRPLKIEVRKEPRNIRTEQAIAYSKYSNIQVLLKVVKPEEMLKLKVGAFLDRKEIRDVFDIDFLVKKGITLGNNRKDLAKLLATIEALTTKDYSVKLGSLLEQPQRAYYIKEKFKMLKMSIYEKLNA
jgi:predicted nucleotidyltransferase component of viral defense system